MIDAVDPVNIPAGFNGTLAVRATVLADPAGQVFDVEPGNAPAARAVAVMADRVTARRWSIAYVNESNITDVEDELAGHGLGFTSAELWPHPGVYVGAADPSRNVAAGRWRLPARPVFVQDRYMGTYDLSTTADNFPARVLGYMDGPVSAWPAAAWARFVLLPDAPWSPDPGPGPGPFHPNPVTYPMEEHPVYLANDGTAQYTVSTDSTGARTKQAIGTLADPAHPELAQLAQVFPNLGTVPTFLSQCKTVGA